MRCTRRNERGATALRPPQHRTPPEHCVRRATGANCEVRQLERKLSLGGRRPIVIARPAYDRSHHDRQA
jgi:hypothetical protein